MALTDTSQLSFLCKEDGFMDENDLHKISLTLEKWNDRLKSKKEELYEQQKKLCKMYEKTIKQEEDLHSKKLNLESKIIAAQKNFEHLSKKKDISAKTADEAMEKVANKKNDVEAKKLTVENRRKSIKAYEKHLGMKVKRVEDNHLMFAFKNIDKENCDSSCVFQILVDGPHYKVTKCIPPIESLDDLQKELNKTSDFSRFIIQMRENFQRLVP